MGTHSEHGTVGAMQQPSREEHPASRKLNRSFLSRRAGSRPLPRQTLPEVNREQR